MKIILLGIVAIPLVVSFTSWFFGERTTKLVTICTGIAVFVATLILVPSVLHHGNVSAANFLYVDSVSMIFLIPTAFLYATTAIFSAGYIHSAVGNSGIRYNKRFYVGLNLFCWALLLALVVNSLALVWVAIEITTIVSVLLVAIDNTEGATEAAWKYLLIASLGLGIALIATIFIYYAGSHVFGSSYSLSFTQLLAGAAKFPTQVVRLAFVLSVIGYGTKVGLVPVHTWLPDAHSEAPTPVSALLSGSLLSVSFYGILRFFQVTEISVGKSFPRGVLLTFGLASLFLAALYLLSQRDIKRLLSYSSIEHMGILAIGMSFSAPIAIFGVLLHVIAHAFAKGGAFFGTGSLLRKFQTKDIARIKGAIGLLPYSGPMFLLTILALSAMPPFGIFRSEFLIVMGALENHNDIVGGLMIVLITVAFLGLTYFATQTILTPNTNNSHNLTRGEPSYLIVTSMALCLVGLIILGIHPPTQLVTLINHATTELEG